MAKKKKVNIADALNDSNDILTGMQDAGLARGRFAKETPKKKVKSKCLADDPLIKAIISDAQETSDRLDRIVNALSKAKSVKGL